MRITFEAPNGHRILRHGFWGITTHATEGASTDLWWSYEKKAWVDGVHPHCSSHAPCKSFKAFLKHIRKHPELRGRRVIFVSRYVGHNISVEVTHDRA